MVDADEVLCAGRCLCAEHISAERLALEGRAVALHREGDGAEGIVAAQQVGRAVGAQRVVALAQTVERECVELRAAHQSVAYADEAAVELHHVDGVALWIIIIVVALYGREGQAVAAVGAEHRVAEGVAYLHRVLPAHGPALLPHGVCHGYLLLHALDGLVVEVFLAEVAEVVEALLLVFQEHGRVVDAAVLGVVFHHHTVEMDTSAACPVALEGVGVEGERVGQIDDVAGLSVLEERGVALGGDLLYLPLHRRQLHLILARQLVGIDHHAVPLGVDTR